MKKIYASDRNRWNCYSEYIYILHVEINAQVRYYVKSESLYSVPPHLLPSVSLWHCSFFSFLWDFQLITVLFLFSFFPYLGTYWSQWLIHRNPPKLSTFICKLLPPHPTNCEHLERSRIGRGIRSCVTTGIPFASPFYLVKQTGLIVT